LLIGGKTLLTLERGDATRLLAAGWKPPYKMVPVAMERIDGTTLGVPIPVSTGWGTVRGAFGLNGRLYTGTSTGTLQARSFDGTIAGPPTQTCQNAPQIGCQTNSNCPGATGPCVAKNQRWIGVSGSGPRVSTNEPWMGVPDMFRENRSYYLLGFRSTAPPNDDRFRRLSIRVNRPGVEVRSRNGYFPVKPEKVKNVKGGPPSAVDTAIAKAMPTGDLPLSVATAAFAVPGRKTAELAVIAGVNDHLAEADVSRSRRVKVIATAFDTAWRSKGAATQTVELTLRPNVSGDFTYDVISRLPLAPGRYEIRYAADTEGRTGSVFVDIDVPDFAKAPLSLSGVLLQATPAVPVAPPNALSGLVPIVPTARRVFAPDDLVTAFVRVYQGSSVPLGSVTMSARAVDDRDHPVFNQTVTLDAARFSGSRAADYQVDLPLAQWPAGEYLVTLDVSRGQSTAHRAVRITVR
jgi:hypothetical protein